MSDTPETPAAIPASADPAPQTKAPDRIFLVPYPKIVFLYPTFLMAVIAAACMTFLDWPPAEDSKFATALSIIVLDVLALNLVILAFDFPRTTSLTLFFFVAALVMGLILLFTFQPQLLPAVFDALRYFRPLANATFYWSIVAILGTIYVVVMINVRFDYWEVRANELLHHHGFLSNVERFPSPHLRIDKEITDVFEYMLLGSGRLILQPSDERRAIILDNVPCISRKERDITRMLGALQVQVRSDGGRTDAG